MELISERRLVRQHHTLPVLRPAREDGKKRRAERDEPSARHIDYPACLLATALRYAPV
jgi:hypothetical protein